MNHGFFLDALKTHLQRLSERGHPEAAEPDRLEVDVIWAKQMLLRVLVRVENGESEEKRHAAKVQEYLEWWQTSDRLVVFARQLMLGSRQGLTKPSDLKRQQELVELGFCRWFDIPAALPSRVQTAELDRLVTEATTLAQLKQSISVEQTIAAYAAKCQWTLRSQGQVRISPLGQVLQNLEGKSAVRWVLQVEAQLALGTHDPDRLSKEAARILLARRTWDFDGEASPVDYPESHPCHEATIDRLCNLGLVQLTYVDEEGALGGTGRLTELGIELLTELTAPQPTPLALLAESLCGDMVSGVVEDRSGGRIDTHSSAAAATAKQARMVAHEIRNALLPVQAALDFLYNDLRVLPVAEVLPSRQPQIDQGIRQALRFSTELLSQAELGAKPPEPFEPVQAVRQEAAALAESTKVAIVVTAKDSLPAVLGLRKNFVAALRLLITNALQHGGEKLQKISIALTLQPDGQTISLMVDDDGQGVAPAALDTIFQQGFSGKPGGTGQGLYWVKQTIEDELRGRVVCTHSPLGGARFAIELPVILPSSPQIPARQGVLPMRSLARILVIDDQRSMSDRLSEWLRRDNHDALGVYSVAEGLERLRNSEWDVVVLDIKLDGAEGADVGVDILDQVLNLAPTIKPILMTASANADSIARALRSGAYDYVPKGDDFDIFAALLSAKLRNALEPADEARLAALTAGERETELGRLWESVQSETDSQCKGKALENLLQVLWSSVPGFEDTRPNVKNVSEEIDLIVVNKSSDVFWQRQGDLFLIECKNWSTKVDPKEIAHFVAKIESRSGRCRLGFFIAPMGFTKPARYELAKHAKANWALVLIEAAALKRLVDAKSPQARHQVLQDLVVAAATGTP